MQGLSLHNYSVINWANKFAPVGFGEKEYAQILKETLKMEDLVTTRIQVNISGINTNTASGETLTAPRVDSVNTFDAPNTVTPKPIMAKLQNGKPTIKLDPKSVTVISLGNAN